MSGIESIDHLNLVVQDLHAMTEFYQTLLGLNVSKRASITGEWIDRTVGLTQVKADVVYLDLPGGPRLELIRYHNPPAPPISVQPPNAFGFRHIAFRVDDIDQIVARLSSAGVKFFSAVQSVPDSQVTYAGGVRKRLVYFRDPDGNVLELCEYR
jgi:catechol 2,3-dioxygenase-like lactoylglutathione lyase family enzyme